MTDTMQFTHAESPEQAPWQYRACGLDNVYLTSGYTREEHDGEMYTSVREADALHDAIAEYLVLCRDRLSGGEVRFLRKHLGYTQAELGEFLKLNEQAVARYEKGKNMGPAEGVLRLLVLGKTRGCIDPQEMLNNIRMARGRHAANDDMVVGRSDGGWHVEARRRA